MSLLDSILSHYLTRMILELRLSTELSVVRAPTFAQTRTRTDFWVGVQLQMKSKRQLKNGFRNSVSRMGLIHLIRIQIQVRMHLDIPIENSCDWVMI